MAAARTLVETSQAEIQAFSKVATVARKKATR
jgi:hypothetical protein